VVRKNLTAHRPVSETRLRNGACTRLEFVDEDETKRVTMTGPRGAVTERSIAMNPFQVIRRTR